MTAPWKEWIPGALNDFQLRELITQGFIEHAEDCKPDYSSFDLRLGNEGYKMLKGSIKPQGGGYGQFLSSNSAFAAPLSFDNNTVILAPKNTYVFKLKEKLAMKLDTSKIHGQATAKSSVGRVDVLARLIVDGMHSYEEFDDTMWGRNGGSGDGSMFLEVTPLTFNVRVKVGTSLSQLRLFQGKPDHSKIRGKELYEAVLIGEGTSHDERLRVDVTNTRIDGEEVAAYCAKYENKQPINLWVDKDHNGKSLNRPNPRDYWNFEMSDKERFYVKHPNFYILRSKEKINLPRGVCVYCRAIDETLGEMRIHYAGFVHPYFGYSDKSEHQPGTPLIFEVRGHDVDVVLNNNEPLARLQFYRMSQDCSEEPDPKMISPYNNQTLRLSQFFEDFPEK